jgi:hypothetical protein
MWFLGTEKDLPGFGNLAGLNAKGGFWGLKKTCQVLETWQV